MGWRGVSPGERAPPTCCISGDNIYRKFSSYCVQESKPSPGREGSQGEKLDRKDR